MNARARQPVVIRLLQVPDCPLVDEVRAMVRESARALGVDVSVIDVVGDHPSPTVVIDGKDVVTGCAPAGDASCRLEVPTAAQLSTALQQSSVASQ